MAANLVSEKISDTGEISLANQKSIFKTAENEAKLMALYDARLARWPVPYESIMVPTRYGRTHVIASGPQGAPPIVLMHAAGINATIWLSNAAALSQDYRMLALDTIGEPGKSRLDDFDVYPKNGHEASLWLSDVFDGLGIQEAFLVGSSLGGWFTMNHALYAPGRVKRLVLLGPMGMPTWWATFNILFRLMFTSMFPTESNKESLFRWLFRSAPWYDGELSTEAAEWLAYLRLALDMNLNSRTAMPFRLSNAKLRQITPPTLLILGECDRLVGNAHRVAARGRRYLPNVETVVMANTGHIMAAENPAFVNERILRFLGGKASKHR